MVYGTLSNRYQDIKQGKTITYMKVKRGDEMKEKYLNYFEDYLIQIKITTTAGTYKFYESHLMHIGRFLYERGVKTLEEVDRDITVEYLARLKNTVENSTINKRVGILKRCFIFYAFQDHYIHSIGKYKEKRRSFTMISDSDLRIIIKYINSLDERIGNNLLYKGIILLLINTGVRLTELYNIEKKNVNLLTNEILLTKTKSGEDRIVLFLPVIGDTLKALIEEKHDHKFLLHNRLRNRQVNYSDVNYLFNKLKETLNIKKLHPHMFRHTYATKLLQNGVDIKTVMDLMGHLNMSTTQKYQHSSKEHARKAYLDKYKY